MWPRYNLNSYLPNSKVCIPNYRVSVGHEWRALIHISVASSHLHNEGEWADLLPSLHWWLVLFLLLLRTKLFLFTFVDTSGALLSGLGVILSLQGDFVNINSDAWVFMNSCSFWGPLLPSPFMAKCVLPPWQNSQNRWLVFSLEGALFWCRVHPSST